MFFDTFFVKRSWNPCLTPTISAPRHPAKLENTKPLRGAGALEQRVRRWMPIRNSRKTRRKLIARKNWKHRTAVEAKTANL
jgi:hypothetical protein